jgi:hypothetical protein
MENYRTLPALAAPLAAVLLNMVGQAHGAIIHAASAYLVDVTAAINLAVDGDTVIVPPGTASWASRLDITKAITLQGATTVSGNHSTPMTATDATIILDNTPRSGSGSVGVIKATLSAGQKFRLTGFTFRNGSLTNGAGGNGGINLVSQGGYGAAIMRVDHCHFDRWLQPKDIYVNGWVYGVSDHCIHDMPSNANVFSFLIWYSTYGSTPQLAQAHGHGSWADYPWYGTERFFFIEDNTINGNGQGPTSGCIDAKVGARYVARYNTFNNAQPNSHGTEGGPDRGVRVSEVYNNHFHWTIAHGGGQWRSGTEIWHDNTWDGMENNSDVCSALCIFREMAQDLPLGAANGNNPWDNNDPHGVYDSGRDNSSANSQGVMHDSTKSWSPGQWVGYSITNTTTGLASYITANDAHSITCVVYQDPNSQKITFHSGNTYSIYKVLKAMDQPGTGKGDQLTEGSQTVAPTNQARRSQLWPRNAQEPCYSWNNVYTPKNIAYGFASGTYPTHVANRDFFNLGSGFTANSIPSAVSGRYVASLNGVNFTSEYVYPHPLVSNVPAPPTGLRIVFGP